MTKEELEKSIENQMKACIVEQLTLRIREFDNQKDYVLLDQSRTKLDYKQAQLQLDRLKIETDIIKLQIEKENLK